MDKQQSKQAIAAAQAAIAEVARQNGKTVPEIREAIEHAIAEAISNPDPSIQQQWKQIPCQGPTPSPEELIAWLRSIHRHSFS